MFGGQAVAALPGRALLRLPCCHCHIHESDCETPQWGRTDNRSPQRDAEDRANLGKQSKLGFSGLLGGYVNLLQSSGRQKISCGQSMPVYELFCLARPRITQDALSVVIKTASNSVFSHAGVLTDILCYGVRHLAYPIRKAGDKYTKVGSFLKPAALLYLSLQCGSGHFFGSTGGDVANAIPRTAVGSSRD